MAYELLTGQHPFSDHTSVCLRWFLYHLLGIDGISEEVQKNIQDVIFKALAYDPKERKKHYKNVKEFAEALEKACFGYIRKKRLSRDARQDLYQKIARIDKTISLDSQ